MRFRFGVGFACGAAVSFTPFIGFHSALAALLAWSIGGNILASAIGTAVGHGLPVPALGSALAYFDTYRRARLPANLIQAQRDYFGAHGFERTDRPGSFHGRWQDKTENPQP